MLRIFRTAGIKAVPATSTVAAIVAGVFTRRRNASAETALRKASGKISRVQ
jgi:hypothetical protein